MKYKLLIILTILSCNTPTIMNDTIIYKKYVLTYQPHELFIGDAIEVAQAIKEDDVGKVKKMLYDKQINPNTIGSKNGIDFLLWAAAHKSRKTLKVLLDLGADPNRIITADFYENEERLQPRTNNLIGDWLSRVTDIETLELVLKNGGNANGNDGNSYNVFRASGESDKRAMWLLINYGADVTKLDIISKNPLSYDIVISSIENGWQDCLKLLEWEKEKGIVDVGIYQLALEMQQEDEQIEVRLPFTDRERVRKMLIEWGIEFPVADRTEFIAESRIKNKWKNTEMYRKYKAEIENNSNEYDLSGDLFVEEHPEIKPFYTFKMFGEVKDNLLNDGAYGYWQHTTGSSLTVYETWWQTPEGSSWKEKLISTGKKGGEKWQKTDSEEWQAFLNWKEKQR